MSRYIYVNGRHVPYADACVHVEDRGYPVRRRGLRGVRGAGGRLVDETRHLDRLDRSLGELRIPAPMSRPAWQRVLREVDPSQSGE